VTKKRTLDVRGLACPEPAEAVLEAVATLASGQYLEVIHDQEPKLLYPHLQKRGFAFLVQKGDEPVIKVLIWRQQDLEAKDAVDAAGCRLL
jgi:TusA-related sulfurtransferase